MPPELVGPALPELELTISLVLLGYRAADGWEAWHQHVRGPGGLRHGSELVASLEAHGCRLAEDCAERLLELAERDGLIRRVGRPAPTPAQSCLQDTQQQMGRLADYAQRRWYHWEDAR